MQTRTVRCLAPIILLAACASTPGQQWVQGSKTYTAVLQALTVLRQQGKISDSDFEKIEVARIAARSALDELEIAVAEGDKFGAGRALNAFNRALEQLIQWRARAGRG